MKNFTLCFVRGSGLIGLVAFFILYGIMSMHLFVLSIFSLPDWSKCVFFPEKPLYFAYFFLERSLTFLLSKCFLKFASQGLTKQAYQRAIN